MGASLCWQLKRATEICLTVTCITESFATIFPDLDSSKQISVLPLIGLDWAIFNYESNFLCGFAVLLHRNRQYFFLPASDVNFDIERTTKAAKIYEFGIIFSRPDYRAMLMVDTHICG